MRASSGVGARHAMLFLYGAAALWFSVRTFFDSMRRLLLNFPWSVAGWGDGAVDWQAARLFLGGRSPYTPDGLKEIGLEAYGFGHPPTTPFWFLPMAGLDHATMAETMAFLCMLVLFVHIWLCVRELGLPARVPTVLLVFSWVLSTSWMQEHLHIIQISEFIAFAYVVAWYHLKRGRDVAAGVTLGFACTLKLFPGVMVFFLMVTKRWRAVAAAMGSYLVVAAIMTAGYGLSSWQLFFQQQGPISATWMGHIRNASLTGIVLRLFTPTCVAQATPTAKTVLLAEVLAILLVAAATILTRRSERARKSIDMPYAMFTLVSVFINPWIWEHYSVFLIFPMLVFIAWLWRDGALAVSQLRDRAIGPRAFAIRFAVLLGGTAIVFAIVRMLEIEMLRKTNAFVHYVTSHEGSHRELHLLEVANWLPWVLMIAVFAGLTLRRAQRRSLQPG